uniref:Uncharacterized protein n=1 Tax=Timema bartmani TaxID=61472 RepID=A0A7R9ESL9_9NEOP|nr:unnamed protein product [Timema bartmani]
MTKSAPMLTCALWLAIPMPQALLALQSSFHDNLTSMSLSQCSRNMLFGLIVAAPSCQRLSPEAPASSLFIAKWLVEDGGRSPGDSHGQKGDGGRGLYLTQDKSNGSTDLHSKKQKVAEFFERVCPEPQPVNHRTKKTHSSPAHGRSSHHNVEDQNPRIDLSKVSRSACLFRENARNQPCHLDVPYMGGTISSSSDLDSLISDVSAKKNVSATNLAGTDKKAPKLLSLPRNVTKSTQNNYFSTDEVDSDNVDRITTLQDRLQGEVQSMKHNIFKDYLKQDDGETEKSYDSLDYDTYFKPFSLETPQGNMMVHKEMYGQRSMGVSMPSQSKSDMSMELNIKPNKYPSRTQQKSLGNESNIDKSSPNQSWSIFSKSSTSQRQYSTDDDSY